MKNSIIDNIMKHLRGFDAHVILYSGVRNLTRFGDNEISQNVSSKDIYAYVRISDGEKVVKFVISKFDGDSIKSSFDNAKKIIKLTKKADFIPQLTKTTVKIDGKSHYDESAFLTPYQLIKGLKK
ncbi:MAG: hypothetical protein K6357_05120 [Elusimicrobiota bacterium]